MSDTGPRTVVDPTTGRPILLAPERQKRPMHTGSKKVRDRCPFCEGHEADTPPEVDAVRRDDSAADAPGWIVRAFPNKYPAARRHEVIAAGPAHTEHPCELDEATLEAAVALWQRRVTALEQDPEVACAFLFQNVGARAGASIAHTHSQLIGLDRVPPRLVLEREQQRAAGRCLVCASLATAPDEDRVVFAHDDYVAFAPDPPKMPFETWLAPRRCTSDFERAEPAPLAAALHAWLRALDGALVRPACNLWLHRIPTAHRDGEAFHWHFELQPRTGQLAGLELGGDMYINSVPAGTTARRFRDALDG